LVFVITTSQYSDVCARARPMLNMLAAARAFVVNFMMLVRLVS